jgi:hypothetical protein
LTKKNGEIYVHRGKALREKVQKRTRLLSFNLASTEFLIFSDVSMTGKAKILDIIKVFTDIQSPSENRTVRYSNGHFPDTICVRFSNGKIGHLVFDQSKTGPVFRPQYLGKAN